MTGRQGYASLRVLEPAAAQFRRLARMLAAQADRDVTQSEALDAATGYALEHLSQVAGRLPKTEGATPNESR